MEGTILPNVLCNSTPSREISLDSLSFSSPSLSVHCFGFLHDRWHLMDNKYTAVEMHFKC